MISHRLVRVPKLVIINWIAKQQPMSSGIVHIRKHSGSIDRFSSSVILNLMLPEIKFVYVVFSESFRVVTLPLSSFITFYFFILLYFSLYLEMFHFVPLRKPILFDFR